MQPSARPVVVSFIALLIASAVYARELTFEERVRAQEAIERVYYSHQIGATKPFEEAVPRSAIEGRVSTFLEETSALETYWGQSITRGTLRGELERIFRETRMPERLSEVARALDDDPFLLQECLARPILTDRLVRNAFARDARIHARAREEAEAIREQLLRRGVDARSSGPHFSIRNLIDGEIPHDLFVAWRADAPRRVGEIGPLVELDDEFVIRVVRSESAGRVEIAEYTVPKISWDAWWQRTAPAIASSPVASVADAEFDLANARRDATACPADDAWLLRRRPTERQYHVAVWTGSLMIVWGGTTQTRYENSGGRYDPVTDTWSPTSLVNAPTPRQGAAAVWTGSKLVVWGGFSFDGAAHYYATGGIYDPSSDTWTATATANAPAARSGALAVWTGSVAIVWGGFDLNNLVTGGRYDPVANSWTPTSTFKVGPARGGASAVWTGSEMIVWGGDTGIMINAGYRYDPVQDRWKPTSTTGAPAARRSHVAIWTGSTMLVWGGYSTVNVPLGDGGRYDPASDSWSAMSTSGAPQARSDATGIWTGSRMVVWAGDPGTGAADPPSGGRYDPIGNVWSLVTSVGAPASRTGHTSVWTGSLMLTWGGALAGGQVADDGGRYDPIHDTWTPLAPSGAPSARYGHSAVWTGNEMIVWGGSGGGNLASGARFDPVMASWTSTSLIGAPAARSFHAAFWTGSTMLIWGGQTSPGGRQLGARYDPQTDTWAAISEAGAPVKLLASAVWSGQQLIVWGGFDGSTQIQTGGRYDPAADVWTPTSTTNAPEGRTNHAAAWTGSRMLIWGGHKVSPPSPPVYFSTGGLYDPSSDSWTATATVGAPAGEDPNFGVWVDDTFVVGDYSHTGGRYRPAQDAWAPISTVGMPAPSSRSVVVTGPLMVVWGNSDWHLGDQGARYDPVGDVWSATSTNGAPIGRYWHSAVWTGSSMLVWGGNNNWGSFRSGGEYIADPDLDGDGFNACLGDCAARNGAVYPGAPQVCDGVNNDCTAPGWPSLAGSNESDNDGDGSSACAGDCNDSDPGTHAAPIEVANVRLGKSAGSVVVSWDSEASLAGASTTYDVVDGSLAALRSTATYSGAACLASGVSVTSLNDAPPAPASASYYLVRASNACGLATFGDSSFVPDPRDALDAGSTCP